MLKSKNCSHTIFEDYQNYEYDDNDNKIYFWETRQVSACVDIDLHRYKCSMCGEIGYYSSAARDFYEKGIKSNIRGLE